MKDLSRKGLSKGLDFILVQRNERLGYWNQENVLHSMYIELRCMDGDGYMEEGDENKYTYNFRFLK